MADTMNAERILIQKYEEKV